MPFLEIIPAVFFKCLWRIGKRIKIDYLNSELHNNVKFKSANMEIRKEQSGQS